jgi:hypothetical protein
MPIKFPRGPSNVPTFEVGAKVRALGGPFAGRIGVISKLDGKGGARVTFGLLSARVPLHDLGPFVLSARPSLKTSHRRLEPARSLEDVRDDPDRSKKNRSLRRKPPP